MHDSHKKIATESFKNTTNFLTTITNTNCTNEEIKAG
jgi:hypothetical protein